MMKKLKRSRGFALMDLMLYMIIFSVLAAFAAKVKLSADQDKADQAAGQHLAVIRDGVQQYIDLYRSQILAGTAIPGIVTLLAPTVAELQGLNNPPVMSTSIGVQGGNGQTYSIMLTRLPAGCTMGVNCTDLFALISSTQPWMGDDGLPQTVRLANMAATVGGDGAIVDPSATTTLKGADGTWTGVANPYGAAEGYVFARAGFGSVTDLKLNALLPRDGSRGITNIVTKGQACAVPNGLGADTLGRVFSCQGGTYQLANGSGNITDVATIGTACTDDGALSKSISDSSAILICSSGLWSLGAGNNVVLRDGSRSMLADLNMGGNSLVNANDVGASGTVTANNVTASGRISSSDALLSSVITPNSSCSPNGLMARDVPGLLYTCQSGVWKKATGNTGSYASVQSVLDAFDGETIDIYAYGAYIGRLSISSAGVRVSSGSNYYYWNIIFQEKLLTLNDPDSYSAVSHYRYFYGALGAWILGPYCVSLRSTGIYINDWQNYGKCDASQTRVWYDPARYDNDGNYLPGATNSIPPFVLTNDFIATLPDQSRVLISDAASGLRSVSIY